MMQKHVGQIRPAQIELETRVLAKLPVDAEVEYEADVKKAALASNAQATEIPGLDLTILTPQQRTAALKRLNEEAVRLRLRVDDRSVPDQRLDLRGQPAARRQNSGRGEGGEGSRSKVDVDRHRWTSSSFNFAFFVASVGFFVAPASQRSTCSTVSTCFTDGSRTSISSLVPGPIRSIQGS